MKEKIKKQKGFIRILTLIGIIIGVILFIVIAFVLLTKWLESQNIMFMI